MLSSTIISLFQLRDFKIKAYLPIEKSGWFCFIVLDISIYLFIIFFRRLFVFIFPYNPTLKKIIELFHFIISMFGSIKFLIINAFIFKSAKTIK